MRSFLSTSACILLSPLSRRPAVAALSVRLTSGGPVRENTGGRGTQTDARHEVINEIKAHDIEQCDPVDAAMEGARKSVGEGPEAVDTVGCPEGGIDTSPLRPQDIKRAGRRKRTMNDVLGDVLNDAMTMKDKGEKPDMEYIYSKTQERIYESEHGRKPPSGETEEIQKKYLPFPPDLRMHRLEPLPSDDPWPARAITLDNPILSNADASSRDEELAGARRKREKKGNPVTDDEEEFWDDKRRMYVPRNGIDPVEEFTDSIEEHYYWEEKFVEFVREAPLWQRRSLPFLHEHYRMLAHRLLRAESRFIHCRDAALAQMKGSASLYAKTEERIDRSRRFCADTHKSLSSPSYNPVRMKRKSLIGLIMGMTDEEYMEWLVLERVNKNNLMAEFAK